VDQNCTLYYNAFLRRKCTVLKMPDIAGFKVITGKSFYFFRGGQTPLNDCVAAAISTNKFCVNKLLSNHEIPVPKSMVITKEEYEVNKYDLRHLRFPVVTKPAWEGSCGLDVTCNIKDKASLAINLESMFKKYQAVCIEDFKQNLNSFRVLVCFGKVIGVVQRTPSCVTGDGRHTITELMNIQNKKRKKLSRRLPLGSIEISDETLTIFKELGINETHIPWQGETIPMRYVCNSTYGGSMRSLETSSICKENAELAIKAAKILKLNLVGFDILCEDIGTPILASEGYFIEANFNPDNTIHENTKHGTPVAVSDIIVRDFLKFEKPMLRKKNLALRLLPMSIIFASIGMVLAIYFYA
jgi:D-alanine-D-alanine ligase-like ATP-grasp enzyme